MQRIGRWPFRGLSRFACAAFLGAGLTGCEAPSPFDQTLASNNPGTRVLRTDTNPADVPFNVRDLSNSFEDIVFQYEFHFRDGILIRAPIEKPLKRWEGTIRYQLIGDAVEQRDIQTVAHLTARLSTLTGLQFTAVDQAPDMQISIATAKGRREISQMLGETGQDIYRQRYDLWRRTPGWVCGATLSSDANDRNRLVQAHIFLPAEASGLRRQACLHEEIVQSLGLTNDSDRARPSIFNDDQEFALLTTHDEILVAALYDPRLSPGMNAGQATPIARRIFEASMQRVE